jgi:hypothetical protein
MSNDIFARFDIMRDSSFCAIPLISHFIRRPCLVIREQPSLMNLEELERLKIDLMMPTLVYPQSHLVKATSVLQVLTFAMSPS